LSEAQPEDGDEDAVGDDISDKLGASKSDEADGAEEADETVETEKTEE
jgi:hypothetical protein